MPSERRMLFRQRRRRASVQPVQIVSCEGGRVVLNRAALRQVLQHRHIRDAGPECEIVPVNIAGSARSGKSFILNILLEYFYAEQARLEGDANADWRAEGTRFHGFHFINSTDSDTQGIWMWGEPIMLPLQDRLLAVVLMDTQGLFDATILAEATETSYSLFALSALISSVQVFNVMRTIEAPSIAFYRMLIEFGAAIAQDDEHAFQTMYLLVRDFSSPHEYPYGLQQNDRFFRERGRDLLATTRFFENAGCILLPRPGEDVMSNPQFTGDINQISSDFLDHVGEVASHMISSGELCGKKINGKTASAGQLIQYCVAISECIERNRRLLPQDLVNANAQIARSLALQAGIDEFKEVMQRNLADGVAYSSSQMNRKWERALRSASRAMWRSPRADQVCTEEDENLLLVKITEIFDDMKRLNDERVRTQEERQEREKLDAQIREQQESLQRIEAENKAMRRKMRKLQTTIEEEKAKAKEAERQRKKERKKEKEREKESEEERERETSEEEESPSPPPSRSTDPPVPVPSTLPSPFNRCRHGKVPIMCPLCRVMGRDRGGCF